MRVTTAASARLPARTGASLSAVAPTHPQPVLIADDDPAARDAYRAVLGQRSDFVLVAEASNGEEAITLYERHRPAVVLMDLQMPGTSGIEATAAICARWPDACIVAMTSFGTRDYVVAALRAGAAGYLLKGVGGPALLAALHQALGGNMPLASTVRRQLVSAVLADAEELNPTDAGLTPRELELVGWLAQGLTNQQIARAMHLSVGSVKQYLGRVGDKLKVASRTQILVRVIQLGIVDPSHLPAVSDRTNRPDEHQPAE